jgi:hypothetical protein
MKAGIFEIKIAALGGLFHRSNTDKSVGKVGDSNKCLVVWLAIPHSGQRSSADFPMA